MAMDEQNNALHNAERSFGELKVERDALYWLLHAQVEQLKRIADALENPPKTTLDISDAVIRIADAIRALTAQEEPTP